MELSQLKEKLLGEFDDVFSDKLMHQMEGKDMVIHLRPGHGEPYNRAYTRNIPVHHQDEAAKMIKEMIKNGIIKEQKDPTAWLSPAHFVLKKSGKLRLVLDFTKLNREIMRPTHPFPLAADIVASLKVGAKYFASVDCVSGYHQIKLAKESQHLTCFLLPTGRYVYLVEQWA